MSKHILLAAGLLTLGVLPPRAAVAQAPGRASAAALASARTKENSLRAGTGPDNVTLTPDEMASLVEANLHREARRALDSIRVQLRPGRLVLTASIVIAMIQDVLGPMAMMLNEREPLAVGGPARTLKAGLITFEPDSVVIRSFSFPRSTIPNLVSRLTGSPDGTIPIAVPPTVQRIWITPAGVTFSRKAS